MTRSKRPDQSSLQKLSDYYKNNKYIDAEKLATSLTKEFPNHAYGWKVLGAIFGLTNRQLESLNAFETVVKLEPNDPDALFNLSIVLQDLDRFEESKKICEQLLKIKPDFGAAHFNLGFIMQNLNILDGSEKSYKTAISLKPDWAEAYFNLANTQQKLKKLQESESAYKRAIQYKSNYYEAFNNLGNIYKTQGKFDLAAENYQLALKINPSYSEARINLNTVNMSLVPAWHLKMMNDEMRNKAYLEAIKLAINNESYVLEVGSGSGILSMMAASCGAKNIISCESSKSISNIAKKVISENGYENQISIINKHSTELVIGRDLSKKADIVISEILSAGFVGEAVRSTILDVKERLLKKNGKIIPEMGFIKVALVEENDEISNSVFASKSQGFDLSEFNSITQTEFSLSLNQKPNYLTNSMNAFSINLYEDERIEKKEKVIRFEVTKSGLCLGLIQWLKIKIYDDIEYENKPGEVNSHWPTPFYRFEKPIKLKKGDLIEINAFLDKDDICFYKL